MIAEGCVRVIAEGSDVWWWARCGVGVGDASAVRRGWNGFLADFADCAEWLEQHLHCDVVFLILEVGAEECTKIVLSMLSCEDDEHGTEFVEDLHKFSGFGSGFVVHVFWCDG